MIEKATALIAQTPAARPSTPSEKLTTFMTSTSPTTVSGPPADAEVDRADERQREVRDLDAGRDRDRRRQDLAGELEAGRQVEAVVERADDGDQRRAGEDPAHAVLGHAGEVEQRRRDQEHGGEDRQPAEQRRGGTAQAAGRALVDGADAPREARAERRQHGGDGERHHEGEYRVAPGHACASLVARRRSPPPRLHRGGRAEVLVERVAVGELGHALGQLGAARLEGRRQCGGDDPADLGEVVGLQAARGQCRRARRAGRW